MDCRCKHWPNILCARIVHVLLSRYRVFMCMCMCVCMNVCGRFTRTRLTSPDRLNSNHCQAVAQPSHILDGAIVVRIDPMLYEARPTGNFGKKNQLLTVLPTVVNELRKFKGLNQIGLIY